MLPPAAWYAYAYVIHLNLDVHMFGAGLLRPVALHQYLMIAGRLLEALTPQLVVAASAGCLLALAAGRLRFLHAWLAGVTLFVVIAGRGNLHPWYQLPLVPIAAGFAGAATDAFLGRMARVPHGKVLSGLVTTAVILSMGYNSLLYLRERQRPWALPLMRAGQAIDRISPADSWFVMMDSGDPTAIYYSRRHGQHFYNPKNSLRGIRRIERFRGEGASYFVLTRFEDWWPEFYPDLVKHLRTHYPVAEEDGDFTIFDLRLPIELKTLGV